MKPEPRAEARGRSRPRPARGWSWERTTFCYWGLASLFERSGFEAAAGRRCTAPRGVGTTMQVTLPLTAPDAAGSAVVVIGRPDDIGRDLAAGPEPWAPARGS